MLIQQLDIFTRSSNHRVETKAWQIRISSTSIYSILTLICTVEFVRKLPLFICLIYNATFLHDTTISADHSPFVLLNDQAVNFFTSITLILFQVILGFMQIDLFLDFLFRVILVYNKHRVFYFLSDLLWLLISIFVFLLDNYRLFKHMPLLTLFHYRY